MRWNEALAAVFDLAVLTEDLDAGELEALRVVARRVDHEHNSQAHRGRDLNDRVPCTYPSHDAPGRCSGCRGDGFVWMPEAGWSVRELLLPVRPSRVRAVSELDGQRSIFEEAS